MEEQRTELEGIKDQLESLEETINNKFDELIETLKNLKN
jgi:prefoldin subunit 5